MSWHVLAPSLACAATVRMYAVHAGVEAYRTAAVGSGSQAEMEKERQEIKRLVLDAASGMAAADDVAAGGGRGRGERGGGGGEGGGAGEHRAMAPCVCRASAFHKASPGSCVVCASPGYLPRGI